MDSELVTEVDARAAGWIATDLIISGEGTPGVVVPTLDAVRRGDREVLDTLFLPELTVDDRRARTDAPMRGRDELLSALAAYGPNAFDARLLAVRGGRYAMLRLMVERTEGGIADMVVILGGSDSTLDVIQVHDTASFGDAVRVFSGAFVASLRPELQAVVGVSAATLGAIVERRYDDLRDRLSPDFVYRDTRDSGLVEFGREEAVGLLQSVFEETPGQYDYVPEVLELSTSGLVATFTQATVADLGATEVDAVVMGVDGGQLQSMTMVDVRRLDRASHLLRSWG